MLLFLHILPAEQRWRGVLGLEIQPGLAASGLQSEKCGRLETRRKGSLSMCDFRVIFATLFYNFIPRPWMWSKGKQESRLQIPRYQAVVRLNCLDSCLSTRRLTSEQGAASCTVHAQMLANQNYLHRVASLITPASGLKESNAFSGHRSDQTLDIFMFHFFKSNHLFQTVQLWLCLGREYAGEVCTDQKALMQTYANWTDEHSEHRMHAASAAHRMFLSDVSFGCKSVKSMEQPPGRWAISGRAGANWSRENQRE